MNPSNSTFKTLAIRCLNLMLLGSVLFTGLPVFASIPVTDRIELEAPGQIFWRIPHDNSDISFHDGYMTDLRFHFQLNEPSEIILKLHLENDNISNGYLVNNTTYSNLTFSFQDNAFRFFMGDMERISLGQGLLIREEEYYGLGCTYDLKMGQLFGYWTSAGFTRLEDLHIAGGHFELPGIEFGGFLLNVGTENSERIQSHAFLNGYGRLSLFDNLFAFSEVSLLSKSRLLPSLDGAASLAGVGINLDYFGASLQISQEIRHYDTDYLANYYSMVTDTYLGFEEDVESFNNIRNYMLSTGEVWGNVVSTEIKIPITKPLNILYNLENLTFTYESFKQNFAFYLYGVSYRFSEDISMKIVASNRISQKGLNNPTLQIPARDYYMISLEYVY